MNATDLLTAADAAALTGWSVPTITRMAVDGTLPTAVKLPGLRGPRLFHRSAVEALTVKAQA